MAETSVEDISVNAPAKKRILSFDIIRGFLLLAILVGHIELPPDFYDFFTGRGRLFVSAAEGFFFLSGLLVGMVYRHRIAKGMKFIFKKMWRRAAQLYLGSISLTLLFVFIAVKTNHLYIKSGLPIPVDWHYIVTQTLIVRFEYGWADFLGRFAILMLIAPFVFYLLAKGRWKLFLAIIVAAWVLRGQNFTLGWQLIFNGGMLVGFYWDELKRRIQVIPKPQKILIKRLVMVTAAVTFIYSYATVYVLSVLNERLTSIPGWLANFTIGWNVFTDHIWAYSQKWTLGPLRIILFIIWGCALYMLVRKYQSSINNRTKGILLLIGQNSLFVYIFHAFIVFTFKFFIPAKTNFFQNFAITSLALFCLIGGTFLYRQIWNQRDVGRLLLFKKG